MKNEIEVIGFEPSSTSWELSMSVIQNEGKKETFLTYSLLQISMRIN